MNFDSLFKDKIIQLEDGIFEAENLEKGDYDNQALQYDKLISSNLYNKLMWGNSPLDYLNFLKENFVELDDGPAAEIGCGTLSFSSEFYSKIENNKYFLCDLSYEMLKIGKERLEAKRENSSPIIFLRSDALNMPFKSGTLKTIFSLGILHIFESSKKLLNEFSRILQPKAKLYITSLCTDRKLSAKYLKLLNKKGFVAEPMSSRMVISHLEETGFEIIETKVKGGMVYASARNSN